MIDRRLFFALLLLLAAGSAQAAAPSMILDIHDEGVDSNSDTGVDGGFLALGRVALVPIKEPSSGRELWVTDGTDAGTRPLLDACPGPCSTTITPVGAVESVGIFFLPSPRTGETNLWRSDGTLPGTFPLLEGGASCGQQSAVLGRQLLFSMFDASLEEPRCELWKTDGTVAGTVRVAGIAPVELTTAGNRVFFASSGPEGGLLWTSNGTAAGTVLLHRWPTALPTHLAAAGARLFFVAPQEGLELWTSDGTPGGTRPATRFAPADPFISRTEPGRQPSYVIQALDGHLYFLANDGATGRELWRSDGTAAGTRAVTAFTATSPFLGLETWRVEKLAGRLVFVANDGVAGSRLWTSDGRPGSTAPVTGCRDGCPELSSRAELVRQGQQLVFSGGRDRSELWASDGTGAGTRRLFSSNREDGVFNLVPLLGRVFFVTGSGLTYSLYATDRNLAAPEYLTRLGVVFDALPARPVALGDVGLFALPHDSSRRELWRSDGTSAGTAPVTRIGQNGLGSEPRMLVAAGDAVRLLASDGESLGLWTSRGTAETTTPVDLQQSVDQLVPLGNLTLLVESFGPLWRSDGTPAGTFELITPEDGRVRRAAPLAGRAVFSLSNPDAGASIWSTDGTVAGTRKIFDVPADSPGLSDLVTVGPEAFFVTTSSSYQDRLWVTDGTAAGTRAVTGATGKLSLDSPFEVARLGSRVFFAADDDQGGDELWVSDGTAAGTRPLTDWRVGAPKALLAHQGHLYFFATSREPPHAPALWRSDGTEAGTVLLRSFKTRESLRFSRLLPLGGHLFFVAGDENGQELWRTDGTAEGTLQVHDIVPGEGSSSPAYLTVLGGRLYFAAFDRNHGDELWESDGTAAGTRLVQDIAPDALSSAPRELTAAGGRLYFTADDGVHGREPWVYAPGGAGCVPSEFVLCLGGRFKVEADWRDFEGGSGRGRAVSLTADTGYFWFFEPSNVEVILKTLDGRGINGHHWVFYGALSSVEYTLTVTDTQIGAARRYINPPNRLGSVADTQAFGPLGASAAGTVTLGPAPMVGEAIVSTRSAAPKATCAPSSTRLCLNNGRFAVEARWKAQGTTGTGQVVALPGGDTGYFWFFDPDNVEVVLKVLDGRPLNGKFWVFYGALSNVEYTLTVTDTVTGTVKTYTNPQGRLASVADTGAF